MEYEKSTMNLPNEISQKLTFCLENGYPLNEANFNEYSVNTIVDFLEASHQRFFEKSIFEIEQNYLLLIKVFPNNDQLPIIFNLFLKFQVDLKQHTCIEEKTIFVYAKTIYQAIQTNSLAAMLLIHFGEYSTESFANSHLHNEQYLTEIAFLLKQQEELQSHPLFQRLLNQLVKMDKELKNHAWIEDSLLVKKTKEIEQAIYLIVNDLKK